MEEEVGSDLEEHIDSLRRIVLPHLSEAVTVATGLDAVEVLDNMRRLLEVHFQHDLSSEQTEASKSLPYLNLTSKVLLFCASSPYSTFQGIHVCVPDLGGGGDGKRVSVCL